MAHSLLNRGRPPVFCPGCAHQRVVVALDRAFQQLDLTGERIAIVTDIGCSGLFDTFFNTHAFHGLHGRALTYATGLKMARPGLRVIVTMGDGGLGIGGAHVVSACRRNIDVTLLVLNNFNYGMTGGQCSSTTPVDARVGSGFLNRLEHPLDVCRLAVAAGAGYAARVSAYHGDLAGILCKAVEYEGFSVIDLWGVCPGRYTKRNKLTPEMIDDQLARFPALDEAMARNARKEYGRHYREEAARLTPAAAPVSIEARFKAPETGRREVVILGSAGQRIVTAGELVCLGGAAAGLHATQKNDYPITVLRGHSVSEIILSEERIGFTGIDTPAVVIALAPEGVARRRALFAELAREALVIKTAGLPLPECNAQVMEVDFKARGIKPRDRALAALAVLADRKRILTREMLEAALRLRFKGSVHAAAMAVVVRMSGE